MFKLIYILQDHKKEVIFTSCLFSTTPHLRVNSLHGASSDLNVFDISVEQFLDRDLFISKVTVDSFVTLNVSLNVFFKTH